MPSIVYVQPDGSRQTITADVGSTVMATATGVASSSATSTTDYQ